MMYERQYAEYILIVQTRSGEFKQIVIKSQLSQITENDLDTIISSKNIIYTCGDSMFSLVKYPLNIFRIIEVKPFEKKYLDFIFSTNPIKYITIEKPPISEKLPIKYYFENELLPMKTPENFENIEIINLYTKLPILTVNHINNPNPNFNPELFKLKNSTNNSKIYGKNENITIIKNPNECGYDFFVTGIPTELEKKYIWVIPTARDHNLGDIHYLNGDHIPMLEELQKIFPKHLIYCHIGPSLIYFTLHFHIHKDNYTYERKFPNFDKGLRELHIAKERHITQIINTLKCDGEYFTNLKFNMLLPKLG